MLLKNDSRPNNGWISIFEEVSSQGDWDEALRITVELSKSFKTSAVAFSVYDSDILTYSLYEKGALKDEFDSAPSYWGVSDEDALKRKGRADVLLTLCRQGTTEEELAGLLIREEVPEDDDGDDTRRWVFEEDRLCAFYELLGIPVQYGECCFSDLEEVDDASVRKLRKELKLVQNGAALKKINSLFVAVEEGNIEKIDGLIKSGLNVDTRSNDYHRATPLSIAVRNKDLALTTFLLQLGASLYDSILLDAIVSKHGVPEDDARQLSNRKLIEYLVEKGANVNWGLYWAAMPRYGSLWLLNLFIEAGADVNFIYPPNKTTPLFAACHSLDPSESQTEMIRSLLKHGADVKRMVTHERSVSRSTVVYTSLMLSEKPEILRLLLAAGADPNQARPDGTTALMYHAGLGNADAIEVLLEAGADVTVAGKGGATAIDVARNRLQDIQKLKVGSQDDVQKGWNEEQQRALRLLEHALNEDERL